MIESILKILESWEIDFKALCARLFLGLIILFIFYIVGKLTKNIAYRINSKVLSKYKDVQTILSAIIYYFFLFIGYYLFLQIIGLEQYFVKILAGAGIVGIIAGFALKDIASNAFSGLLLFIEKPYLKNNWIQIDGQFGQVVKVGLLTTSMTNKTGQIIYISNQLIYSGVFINYSTLKKRAIKLQTNIIQFFDIESIEKILTIQIKKISNFLPTETIDFRVYSISNNGNFSLEITFWVSFENENDFLNSISQTLVLVKKTSIENKINIVNTVWLSDEVNSTSAGEYGDGE